jgi:hypothetical protein
VPRCHVRVGLQLGSVMAQVSSLDRLGRQSVCPAVGTIYNQQVNAGRPFGGRTPRLRIVGLPGVNNADWKGYRKIYGSAASKEKLYESRP